MGPEGKDNSEFESANSQRLSREELSDQSERKALNRDKPTIEDPVNAEEDLFFEVDEATSEDGVLESEVLHALEDRETKEGKDAKEHTIDEQLIANLGTGNNDYGVLESLLPQIDFDTIPLTQPKRVLAKSDPNAKGVLPEDEGKSESPPSRALKRKKKPASLLDSYFKGM